LPAEIREAFQCKASEALEVLARCLHSSDERVAILAAQSILDRGFGRPHQSQSIDVSEGGVRYAEVPRKAADADEWLRDHADLADAEPVTDNVN
jgi:hypothetical protein